MEVNFVMENMPEEVNDTLPDINIIGSIGFDIVENINDLISILETMQEDIEKIKEWKEKINSDLKTKN